MGDDNVGITPVKMKKGGDEGEEDNRGNAHHGATLFVSNLPYTATSTDLNTLFSDYAPIRTAFVVTEGGSSKGVGYVTFAIKEDAATTLESIEKNGITLDGRTLRVQWPDNKRKEKGEVKAERKPAPKPKISTVPKGEKDPNAIRTIVISGLPSSVDQKALWKKVRKCDGAEKVDMADGETGVAYAVFSTPANAMHAVEKLHAHVFKGSLLSVTLKKRVEKLVKEKQVKQEGDSTAKKTVAPSRGNRLIVRNLPWDISEKDLRALFLPYGPIYSIHIPPPIAEEEGKKPKARGFAFVWYLSKKDAERAIAGVNGREVIAGAISAPTMNKKERARLRRKLRQQVEAGDGSVVGEKDEDDASDEDSDREVEAKGKGRIVAVDWALSKNRYEEAKVHEEGAEGEQKDEDEGSGEEDSVEEDASAESGSSDEDEEQGTEDESGESDDEMDVDQQSQSSNVGKPTLPAPEIGTTVFIRNVPFDATEDEVRVLFRAFGPLRYARITMDEETGRSRGTAFVCFWKKEDADKAIHQSELLNREAGLATEEPRKNPFSMPSILTPDPSSSLAQSLVLHGRTLDVTRAVTREKAQKLKDEGERAREKADKRNLYLLREGVIFPNTPASASLSAPELEKRNASYNTRRALLRSNPLLYVSKTRLSIRQIPVFVTDRMLKKLGLYAVKAFEDEVKAGSRQALTEEELEGDKDHPSTFDSDDDNESDSGNVKGKKGKRGKKPSRPITKVKQAKIVRQTDRVDPVTGKGKSKGYGFLEMIRHSDALRVLRWANNNPAVGELFEGWWKEELKELIQRMQSDKGKTKSEEGEDEDKRAARLNRAKSELEQLERGEGRKGRKTLIVEFSIENAQVVNRRQQMLKERKEKFKSGETVRSKRQRDDEDSNEAEEEVQKPMKKRKVKDATKPPASSEGKMKETKKKGDPGKSKLGSIIGRKRRERKIKGK